MKTELYEVLLNDLECPTGLTPLLGADQRTAMLIERMRVERALAGEALQNVTALVACLDANVAEHARGDLSTERLVGEVRATLIALADALAYDESTALVAETQTPREDWLGVSGSRPSHRPS